MFSFKPDLFKTSTGLGLLFNSPSRDQNDMEVETELYQSFVLDYSISTPGKHLFYFTQ